MFLPLMFSITISLMSLMVSYGRNDPIVDRPLYR